MKLLLDENLSRRLVPALQQAFPGSSQVALGNVSNDKVLESLISAAESIKQLLADYGAGVVVLE